MYLSFYLDTSKKKVIIIESTSKSVRPDRYVVDTQMN